MVVGVGVLLKGGVIVVVEAVDAVVVVVIGSCILNRSLDFSRRIFPSKSSMRYYEGQRFVS